MMKASVLLGAFAAVVAPVSGVNLKTAVTPAQKVVQMLQNMHEQGKKEMHDEQVAFAAYKQFCDDTAGEKTREISEADAEIEKLVADIAKAESDAKVLGKEIQQLDADIAGWELDTKDSTEIRDAENKDFVATHKDYSESIDALERAIATLKQQNFDRPQTTALLQKLVITLAAKQGQALKSYLKDDPATGLDWQNPESHGYEFQSGGVIEMLEKLLDKFRAEKNELEKEESNNHHNFEILIQDLKNEIKTATDNRDSKADTRATKMQKAANAKSDLAETTATRDSDKEYLGMLTQQCQTKNHEYESRQKLRTEELAALQEATHVLQQTVTPMAEKHLPTMLIQKSVHKALRKVSLGFLQLNSVKTASAHRMVTPESKVQAALAYLQSMAKKFSSTTLSMVAVRVRDDPFAKVKKMVQDLIFRLMEQANQEASHKGWCDTELKSNKQTREAKQTEVDKLTAEINELGARIAKLGQEINDLSTAVTELDAAVAKATEDRAAEKAVNEETIKDSSDAQTAVAQALTILKEFYAKAGEATALLQQTPDADSPITWDKPYTGMQAGNGGIIAMLEVIQSDFARLYSETKADEEQASRDFNTFSKESSVNRMKMTKDIEYKTDKKATSEGKKSSAEKDREGAQAELDAALEYFDKLKPSCIDTGSTFEDRVARRQEEIESLQEALRILSGEDFAAQAPSSEEAVAKAEENANGGVVLDAPVAHLRKAY